MSPSAMWATLPCMVGGWANLGSDSKSHSTTQATAPERAERRSAVAMRLLSLLSERDVVVFAPNIN